MPRQALPINPDSRSQMNRHDIGFRIGFRTAINKIQDLAPVPDNSLRCEKPGSQFAIVSWRAHHDSKAPLAKSNLKRFLHRDHVTGIRVHNPIPTRQCHGTGENCGGGANHLQTLAGASPRAIPLAGIM